MSLSNLITENLLLFESMQGVGVQLQWMLKCSLCNGTLFIAHYPVTDG